MGLQFETTIRRPAVLPSLPFCHTTHVAQTPPSATFAALRVSGMRVSVAIASIIRVALR